MNLIQNLLRKNKKLHFTLIDPEDQSPEDVGVIAKECESYGTDAIMIGGSTVKDKNVVYNTVEAIKRAVRIPTILFPNSADIIPENVDYIFSMILLNSEELRFLKGEQLKGSLIVRKFGIGPIPMAYLVISTSKTPTTVEKSGRLDKIRYDDIEKAVNYAFMAENFLGSDCIYLEAGSNAERPVSNEMVKAIRNTIKIPIIVGGGIRDAKTAKEKVRSGADVIVNGTIIKEDRKKIKEIIEEIKR